jgi:hypothetical protein
VRIRLRTWKSLKTQSQGEAAVDPKAEQDLPVARQALSDEQIQQIIEAALLAAEGPLTCGQFVSFVRDR